jgi:hypothetical protein
MYCTQRAWVCVGAGELLPRVVGVCTQTTHSWSGTTGCVKYCADSLLCLNPSSPWHAQKTSLT